MVKVCFYGLIMPVKQSMQVFGYLNVDTSKLKKNLLEPFIWEDDYSLFIKSLCCLQAYKHIVNDTSIFKLELPAKIKR